MFSHPRALLGSKYAVKDSKYYHAVGYLFLFKKKKQRKDAKWLPISIID